MWWFRGEAKVDGALVCEAQSLGDAGRPMSAGEVDELRPSQRARGGRRAPGRRRADRPVLPCRVGGGARRRRRTDFACQHRGFDDDRRSHARLSVRLDRPGAAGSEISRRTRPPDDRRGLLDPRGGDDESRDGGRRRRDDRRRALRLPRQFACRARLPPRRQRHPVQQCDARAAIARSAISRFSAAARPRINSSASARMPSSAGWRGSRTTSFRSASRWAIAPRSPA